MIRSGRAVAVITARGGSKGVPGKNLRTVAGRSLVAWTVEAASRAVSVDLTVVTSDDERILEEASRSGADVVVLRPPELATDLAVQEDAVLHALAHIEPSHGSVEYIVLLQPTNPLRASSDIDAVARRFESQPGADAMMTVAECEHSPLFASTLPADGSMADFVPDELKRKNRQELPVHYRINGSVCISSAAALQANRSFLGPGTYAFVVDRRVGLDIDTDLDLAVAELLATRPDLV